MKRKRLPQGKSLAAVLRFAMDGGQTAQTGSIDKAVKACIRQAKKKPAEHGALRIPAFGLRRSALLAHRALGLLNQALRHVTWKKVRISEN